MTDVRIALPRSVALQIQKKIEAGEIAVGARLPSQRDLAAEFSVSRASIREAITQLEASGLLRTEAGRGTFVTDGGAAPQQGGHSLPALRKYSNLDLCQFRHMLEGQAARLAAMRIHDEDLTALERNLHTFRSQIRALDVHEASATDLEFHNMIVRISGVQLFIDLHDGFRNMLMEMIELPQKVYNRAWEPVIEHERILEALKRRDPDEARYYMQSHIVRSAERLGILLASDVV